MNTIDCELTGAEEKMENPLRVVSTNRDSTGSIILGSCQQ